MTKIKMDDRLERKNLESLLKLREHELKSFVYQKLARKNMNPLWGDGFVYAMGDIPIMLVAHMDTVFPNPPRKLRYSTRGDIIYSLDGGIGGDDRCGVYALLKILRKYRPYVLFTEEEEIGCVGAIKAVSVLDRPDVKYIVEFDRKGKNDCVFYDCGNQKFQEYIESFGFVTAYGSFSDILVLGQAWDIATVNLSSGYYQEHTSREFILFHELLNNIKRVEGMLKDYMNVPYFYYQEAQDHFLDFLLKDEDFAVYEEDKALKKLFFSNDKDR